MASRTTAKKEILGSVIVPTYKEYKNIRPLVTRLVDQLDSNEKDKKGDLNRNNVEILYVDDNSKDGSFEEVERLKSEGFPVRMIVRTTERGLSSAVLKGFDEAQGSLLMCMDADLQHPPEDAPKLLQALIDRKNADFVIGTRYGEGVAIDASWPLYRRVISKGARLLSRPLTPLSDPMSGFFAIEKKVFQRGRGKVNPIGFKIALELFVKCGCKNPTDVPFSFGVRSYGESKLSGAVIVKYIQQLGELYQYSFGPAFLPVLAVVLLLLAYFVLHVACKAVGLC
eukprot:TRINITY_DN424_c0_g1_i1.p1 TRINITY_DN424_c0_g1~~TRINITY_DN424_c0_g1_i1.p1  ORF type:complete len:283 (+),score=90.07 TRINITY_DN424_c0_g1_i1:1114-1962(+)